MRWRIKVTYLLVKLANWKHYQFISPFWTRYFFAYADYEKAGKNLSYRELTSLVNTEASRNILLGKYTQTGLTCRQLTTRATSK